MADNGALSRDAILGGRAFRVRKVPLGENGSLRLRELTAKELLELQKTEAALGEEQPLDQILLRAATMIAKTAIDDAGKRLFVDEDAEKLVESLSAQVLTDAYRSLLGLSGLTEEAVKKLGEK